MTKLSININKIATLRNARGGKVPNVLQFALDCYRFHAEGITIHPRPDERHITQNDVWELSKYFPKIDCEFNIEGYPSTAFIDMVCRVKPTQVTLVPDLPGQLTSDHGWDTLNQLQFLKEIVAEFQQNNIRVSLFIDTDKELLENAAATGTNRIEFYTGPYAHEYYDNPQKAIEKLSKAAHICKQLNLGINAGHDLNLDNLAFLKQHIPDLLEVSIGHALVADALYLGIENTIALYKRQLQ